MLIALWIVGITASATVVKYSPISGPIIPLTTDAGTHVWARLDFQSARTTLFESCAPFVNCLGPDGSVAMNDGTTLGTVRRANVVFGSEKPTGADVAGILGLGPRSSLTSESAVYMGNYGGQMTMKVLEKWEGVANRFNVASYRWMLEGPISFQGSKKRYHLSDDMEVRFSFQSHDVFVPESFREFLAGRRHASVKKGDRLYVGCSDIGKKLVVGSGDDAVEIVLLRWESNSSHCNQLTHSSCTCGSNIRFHSEEYIEVGRSIFNSYNVVLSPGGIQFVNPGTYGFQYVLDMNPPPIHWFRLGYHDENRWRYVRSVGRKRFTDFMIVSLSTSRVQFYFENALGFADLVAPVDKRVSGEPRISLDEDGSITLHFDGHVGVRVTVEDGSVVSVVFKETGRRYSLQVSEDVMRFHPVMGIRRNTELLVTWPPQLINSDNGRMKMRAWYRDSQNHGVCKLGARPDILVNEDGSFVIQGTAEAQSTVYINSDGISITPPAATLVVVDVSEAGVTLHRSTNEPADPIFTAFYPFALISESGALHFDLLLTRQGAVELELPELFWKGRPELTYDHEGIVIAPDPTSGVGYSVSGMKRGHYYRISFTPLVVAGFLFPVDFSLNGEPVRFENAQGVRRRAFFKQIEVEEAEYGFNVVFLGLDAGFPGAKLGMWQGRPVVSRDESGRLILSSEPDGETYVPRIVDPTSSSVVVEFHRYSVFDSLAGFASEVRFDEDSEEGKVACPICLEEFAEGGPVAQLHACNHLVHGECLYHLRKAGKASCPLCRAPFEK